MTVQYNVLENQHPLYADCMRMLRESLSPHGQGLILSRPLYKEERNYLIKLENIIANFRNPQSIESVHENISKIYGEIKPVRPKAWYGRSFQGISISPAAGFSGMAKPPMTDTSQRGVMDCGEQQKHVADDARGDTWLPIRTQAPQRSQYPLPQRIPERSFWGLSHAGAQESVGVTTHSHGCKPQQPANYLQSVQPDLRDTPPAHFRPCSVLGSRQDGVRGAESVYHPLRISSVLGSGSNGVRRA